MIKTVTIGDLGEIITGNTPPRSKPEYYGTFTPFIKATDISENEKYTYFPEEYYSEAGHQKYIKSLIPKGATCVVTIGSIGKKMTMAHCDCFINQAMNAIIPNDIYDKEYVYYLLRNNVHKLKSLDSGTASGRENVSKSAFSNMELQVIVEKEKQKRIGEILSAYDDLIENNQKQIKLLEEAAQRLYKEWFVDLRFPNYENTPVVDVVPEGWKKKRVADLGIVITGKTPSTSKKEYYDGDIPFVTIPDMHNIVYPIHTERSLSNEGANSQKGKFIPVDSVMVSCIATVGLVNIALTECQTNQQINSIILKEKEMLYYTYCSMKRIKALLDGVGSNGATMTNVNKTKFETIEVVLPTKEIQKRFYDFCVPIFHSIKNLSFSIDNAKQARDRLLPKLMSGELEV